MTTRMEVRQIDAWKYDNDWTYNDSIPLRDVLIEGEPTTRKILNALRRFNFILPKSIYEVDDVNDFEGVWTVRLKKDGMPLFDVIEVPRVR